MERAASDPDHPQLVKRTPTFLWFVLQRWKIKISKG